MSMRYYLRASKRMAYAGLGWLESIPTDMRAKSLFRSLNQGSSVLLCIYRNRNKPTVTALVDQAKRLGMTIALWGLDKPIPDISRYTVGTGPGLRMDLLNRLWKTLPPADVRQLVIADDDFVFTHGALGQLQSAATWCRLGIAQPAHDWTSQCNYKFARKRQFTLARRTTFVEPGPLFIVTRPWIQHVIPFPEDFGMGWGLWLEWQHLQKRGCRLGIIDCISVKHLPPVATDYSATEERERLRSLLLERNLQSPKEAQQTLSTWKVWAGKPPWKDEAMLNYDAGRDCLDQSSDDQKN